MGQIVRLQCESRIERAVVYARGAMVSRRVEASGAIPTDAFELVVPKVSAVAQSGSFRASLSGERQVLGLRSRLVFAGGEVELAPLTATVAKLELELQHIETMWQHLERNREMFQSFALQPRLRGRSRRLDVAARVADSLAVERLVDELIHDSNSKLADLALARESVQRDLAAARVAADQARSAERVSDEHPTQEVVIHIAAGSGELGQIALDYAVPTARWWPAYSVRLTERCTQAAFSVEAFVTQLTLEDWSDVELSLATADMIEDVRLPELASLRLGRYQPPRASGFRAPPGDLELLFGPYDKAMAQGPSAAPARRQVKSKLLDEAPLGALLSASKRPLLSEARAVAPQVAKGEVEVAAPEEAPDDAPLDDSVFLPPAAMIPPQSMRSSIEESKSGGLLRGLAAVAAAPIVAPVAAGAALARMGKRDSDKMKKRRPAKPKTMSLSAPVQRAASPDSANRYASAMPQGDLDDDDFETEIDSDMAAGPDDDWLDFDSIVLRPSGAQRGKLIKAESKTSRRLAQTTAAGFNAVAAPNGARDPLAERGNFDHQYRASGTVDIPSNDRVHRIAIGTEEAGPKTVFRTVPIFDESVFREVEMGNPFAAPLLAGPIDVFIDGALAMTTAIESVDKGGEVRFGLGVEERLRVARNVRVKESTAGMLSRETHVDHEISIELASALGHEATIIVLERIPVTDDKEVTITRLSASPEPAKYKQADRGKPVRGGVAWTLELSAGGKKEITHTYRIELASKLEIRGGNRRD